MKTRLLKKIRKKYSIVKIESNSKHRPIAYEGASFHRTLMSFPYYQVRTSDFNVEYFRRRFDAYNHLLKTFRTEFRSVKNKKVF